MGGTGGVRGGAGGSRAWCAHDLPQVHLPWERPGHYWQATRPRNVLNMPWRVRRRRGADANAGLQALFPCWLRGWVAPDECNFPMCHQWPEPSPVATWLSELIPLAVHARGENVGVWTILLSIFLLVNSYVGYCLHLRWLRQLSNQGVKRTFQCRLHQLNSRSFCVSWLVVTMVPCSWIAFVMTVTNNLAFDDWGWKQPKTLATLMLPSNDRIVG